MAGVWSLPALRPYLTRYGRVYEKDEGLYFDWSNAGFSFRFSGRRVRAHWRVTAPRRPLPWIEVTADGGVPVAVPLSVTDTVTLLLEGAEGEHTVTVRRRSEIGWERWR